MAELSKLQHSRQPWAPKPADKVVRRPRAGLMRPVQIELTTSRSRSFPLNPSLILIYAFAALVGLGTLLLVLPMSHHGEGFTPFVEALFTATSAATVTGLVVVDTPTYWTTSGQLVIVMLMFAGGLGIMTIAASLLILAGQRVSLAQRLVMRETIGTSALTDITRVTVRILLWAVGIQAVGFVVLSVRFFSLDYSRGDAVWHALFQAVSGFNNAGFTSIPNSENLSALGTDKVVLGTIAVLVVLGSLSYWVIRDVVRNRRFSSLTLNTKLVLVFTGVLVLAGATVFYVSEFNNNGTIGNLSLVDQLTSSLFHSINRTSGFSTVDFGQTTEQTNLFFTSLMFIGGASASVAGGIKVNTFALIVIAVAASLRGGVGVSAFGRRVPNIQIQWALVLVVVSFLGASLLAFVLAFIESDYPFLDLLFEAVSALGTVGFSTGLTGDLSAASQVLLAVAMFIGRIGPPLVIVGALSRGDEGSPIRYPTERVLMG